MINLFKKKLKPLTLSEYRIVFAKELLSKKIYPFESPDNFKSDFGVRLLREYIKYLGVCGMDNNYNRIKELQSMIDETEFVYYKEMELNKKLETL